MSNTNFNPYSPHALGLEWFATQEGRPDVPPNGILPGMTMLSRYTEEIEYAQPFVFRSGAKGFWLMEVYDVDNIPAAVLTTNAFLPGADVRVIDAYGWGDFDPAGTQLDIYQALDNLELEPGIWPNSGEDVDNDEFIFNLYGAGYEYSCQFADLAGAYSTEQIVSIELWANVKEFIFSRQVSPMSIRPFLHIGGRHYWGDKVTIEGDTQQEVSWSWETNPANGSTWTLAALEEFAVGGDYSAGWAVDQTGSANNLTTIMQGQLRVVDAGADPRVALGMVPNQPPLGDVRQDGWPLVGLATPTGGFWEKQAGTTYLFLMRRTAGPGWLQWRYLTQPEVDVPGTLRLRGTSVQLQPYSYRPITPIEEDHPDRGYGLLLRKVSGSNKQSLDSQPYASLNDDSPGSPSVPPAFVTQRAFWTRVHAAGPVTGQGITEIEQEFTPVITTEYGYIRLLCRLVPSGPSGVLQPDDMHRLVVRIYDRATDTQQGMTAFVYAADLNEDRTDFQEVGLKIPGVVLNAGTQYYIRVSTAAPAGGIGTWAVQVLSAVPFQRNNPPLVNTGTASTGGQTDAYTLISDGDYAGRWPELDACIVIHTLPAEVTGFAAAASPEPVGTEACSTGDADDAVNYIELSWDSTSVPANEGGGFSHYEIQRDDGDGDGFKTISEITDQTCNSATDDEGRIGCTLIYRIRVVRVDGSPSDWSEEVEVSLTMNVGGFVFTSNFVPSRRVWYQDTNPRRFEFLANQVNRQFYGRDGSVTYQETEDRYDRIPADLIVDQSEYRCQALEDEGCPSDQVGRRVFDPLLVLAGNKKDHDLKAKIALPYICVRDRHGNRWFCAIETPTGEISIETLYTLSIIMTETTQTPAPFDKNCGGTGSGSGSGEITCQLIFDDFDTTGSGDCVALGQTSTSEFWEYFDTEDWCKDSGLAMPTLGAPGSEPAVVYVASTNQFVAATYVENGSTGWAIICRGSAPDDYVLLNVTASDIDLYEVVGGVASLLASAGSGGVDMANYIVQVEQTMISVLENAVEIIAPIATAVSAANYVGMMDFGDGADPLPIFTDFAAGCL